eukprot:11199237-Lingulodinium_polyedra.AAC.1
MGPARAPHTPQSLTLPLLGGMEPARPNAPPPICAEQPCKHTGLQRTETEPTCAPLLLSLSNSPR